jgi:hypothetical protein
VFCRLELWVNSAEAGGGGSAPLGFEQQLRFNRPDAGHQAIHLGHVGGLILSCLVPLPYIRAVSLLVSGISDLHVENVLLCVQVAQLLGQSRLIHRDEVPSRDQASPLCLV